MMGFCVSRARCRTVAWMDGAAVFSDVSYDVAVQMIANWPGLSLDSGGNSDQ